jgi:Outer membrane protein beta-barrel family/CarboxypepD_reg-like domain
MKAINIIMHLLASFLVFVSLNSFSQTGTIKGKAVDGTTNKPVEFASVTILSAVDSSLIKGELTDTTGRFELMNLKQGRYILVISSVEYQKVSKGPFLIDFNQELLDMGEVKMVTDVKTLQEVIVKGSKPIIERRPGSIVMNMDNKFFKTSTSAIDVLKKAPGLQVKPDGSILMRNSVTPKVFIDGKDVPMSASELNNYLSNLRPEEIESIEVINNPSSKYDAQYKGIIDIRLRRDTNLGLSGSYAARYGQNIFSSLRNTLSLTYKTPKVAYSTKLGYVDYGSIYEFEGIQLLPIGQSLLTNTSLPSFSKDLSYFFGVDYSITKNQTLAISLRGFKNTADMNSTSVSNFVMNNTSNKVEQTLNSKPKNDSYSANLNYDLKLDKGKLSLAGSYANYINKDAQDITNKNTERTTSVWKADLNNDYLIRVGQADYSTELAKGKLEIGSKYSSITTNNNLRYDTLANSVFVLDANRTNSFIYDENVVAGYVNYSKEFKKISYRLGLRAENTNTIANSITLNQITKREYIKWLPSFGFNYTIDDNQTISLDFSRRLRRPNFDELNPFRFYISAFTYTEGNPFLLPQETNLLTTSYNYKNLSVAFNVGQEINPISQLPFLDAKTNITAFLRRNFDQNFYYSTDISYLLTITKFWRMQNNLNINVNTSKITYLEKVYERTVGSFSLSGSQTFSLPKQIIFDLSYDYNSANGDALFDTKALYSINLGLQKSFFDKQLNVQMNFNDIFYTYVPQISFREPTVYNWNSMQRYGTRRFVLQLSYNFGKSTYKTKQKQNSSADEENRAKK